MAAAVQVVVDTWPELVFVAVVAVGVVVLARRMRQRHDVDVHQRDPPRQ